MTRIAARVLADALQQPGLAEFQTPIIQQAATASRPSVLPHRGGQQPALSTIT
jgi:hypothetical protein